MRQGNKKDRAVYNGRLIVSRVGALTTWMESLSHQMGSFNKADDALQSEWKLRWHNLKSCSDRPCSSGASKTQTAASRGDRGACCRPRWRFLKVTDVREKWYLVNEATLENEIRPFRLSWVAKRGMRSIKLMSHGNNGDGACWLYSRISITWAR